MVADDGRSVGGVPPSAASVAWRPLGYLLFALAWTAVAAGVLALWVLVGIWVGAPSADATPDVGDAVFALLLTSPALGILLLAVPATLSEAAFGWSFVVRSSRAAERTRRLSANVGGARYPLLAPVEPGPAERYITVVFDASWSPTVRVATVALVAGTGVAGLATVRGAMPWVGAVWTLVVLAGIAAAVRWAAADVIRRATATLTETERRARSAARSGRTARALEARRLRLRALKSDDPDGFARELLAEVDREVVARVRLVARVRNGQADAAGILVGNVVHAMAGTVDDAQVRPLVLRRAREITPAAGRS